MHILLVTNRYIGIIKRSGVYVSIAKATKNENYVDLANKYCYKIIVSLKTKGGLYYNSALSVWVSNRYEANADQWCSCGRISF